MQLPQSIIDLVGTLMDEGNDDEHICLAVLEAWKSSKVSYDSGSEATASR